MITVKFKEGDCAVNPDNKKDCDITLNHIVNWLYFKDSWYIIGGSSHSRDILKSLFDDCNTEEDQLFIWNNLLIVDNYIYFKDE